MRVALIACCFLSASFCAAKELVPPAHPTMRAGLSGGIAGPTRLGFAAGELRYAAHDLLDPSPAGGPQEHVEVELGKVRARYYPKPSTFWLDELTFLRVLAVPPLNTDAMQASWKVRAGIETTRDASCNHCLETVLEGGLGASYQPFLFQPLYLFVTLDAVFNFAVQFDEFLKPGVGPSAGLRFYPTPQLATLLSGSYRYQLLTPVHDAWETTLEIRWMISGLRWALNARAAGFPDGWEGSAGLFYYF